MNTQPARIQVRRPGALIAAVPHLLGFHPDNSLVIVALSGPHGRVTAASRFDLPDPPGTEAGAAIAGRAAAFLHQERITATIVIGYGPGTLVTPLADIVRVVLPRDGVRLHDLLRVHQGRYWSYLCPDPACCPPGGVPVSPADPAAVALEQAGLPAAASRAAVAASIAPVTGPAAQAMAAATRRAERDATAAVAIVGADAVRRVGLAVVQDAITRYRDGGTITDPGQLARIAVGLTSLDIRDDAWARMRPQYRDAHIRLWTGLTRHVPPGYVAGPASLLAFTAWQNGDGALASLALDRALADNPNYTMAHLLRRALAGGLPPSAATLPMTPEEVAVTYQEDRRR